MNHQNSITRFLRGDFQFYIFLVVVFFIPLTKKYIPVLMFSWVVVCVLSLRKIDKGLSTNKWLFIFPVVIYLLHAIGFIYSTNSESAIFDLEIKLTILAIPLAVISIFRNNKINYKLLLQLFVLGNLIASFICIFFAYKNSYSTNEIGSIVFHHSVWPDRTAELNTFETISEGYSKFSYTYLSKIHHPTYFSMYITLSIIILLDLIRGHKKKLGYIILIVYFTVFLWLLSSRAGYLTFIIIFLISTFSRLIQVQKRWISLAVMALGIIASIFVIVNSRLSKNIKEVYEIVTTDKTLSEESDIRLWLWKSGYEVFRENILFGVGTGDIDTELENKYKVYGLESADKQNLNVHSQYMDIAIKLGIIGMIVFLSWFAYAIIFSIKREQFLFFYFNIILLVNFFFEVILNTIAGVAFFVFFYSLLVAMSSKNNFVTSSSNPRLLS